MNSRSHVQVITNAAFNEVFFFLFSFEYSVAQIHFFFLPNPLFALVHLYLTNAIALYVKIIDSDIDLLPDSPTILHHIIDLYLYLLQLQT